MSFPDEVVLKAMSNVARPMEVKKERKKSKGLFSRDRSSSKETAEDNANKEPIDIVRDYYARINKARRELRNG